MIDIGNLALIGGAVAQALYTSKSEGVYRSTQFARFCYSSIWGLAIVIASSFICAQHLLAEPVPWVSRHWSLEIKGYNYMLIAGAIVMVIDELFRLFASKPGRAFVRNAGMATMLILIIALAVHVVLLPPNYN